VRVLNLMGHEVALNAPEGDYYLESMAPDGPAELVPVFEACCPTGGSVIDVGANIGITAIMAGLLAGSGRVIALEPVTETFKFLERNVAQSGLSNVDCVRAALSSAPGSVDLITRPGSNFAAFVGYEDVLDRYPGYTQDVAPALTMDDLVHEKDLHRIDFIKIDVEGYELEVLAGAKGALAEFEPTVFLEANHYCLNVFRRISIVDFIETILATFRHVFAVDASFGVFDLTDSSTHHAFFHENVVSGRFQNLLCGFGDSVPEVVERIRRSPR
jgi:FkbM family methyltransferase